MSKTDLIATVAAIVGTVTIFALPTYIVTQAGVERHNACVQAGGSYTKVAESSMFECVNN